MKKIVCTHGNTKFVRENEKVIIEFCLNCKKNIQVPKELL